jgi:mono/diheme cytochrome c family protein
MRILGEIPVRKFGTTDGQPIDPDGNPDTSFLAKIPADTAFTFQTLDKRGMVLNTAQTWHQLRPGEIRNDCGGCHAHSQTPTDFNLTAAAKPDYNMWDLIDATPLLTTKNRDESKRKWNAADDAGLRFVNHENGASVVTVEYWRDIKPILQRSCVACHSSKSEIDRGLVASAATNKAAGNLDLDADDELIQYEQHGRFPGTYYRLALDEAAKFGYRPIGYDSWGYPNASRYIRKMQSRRSLLVWKISGQRLDGFSNDDHPSEPEPGAGYFIHKGQRVPTDKNRARYDLDYQGTPMPPPDAVAGNHKTLDGRTIKVAPLTDEDRFTIVRWIDLGCPIDLDYDPQHPDERHLGWMLDDTRPTLTLTTPQPGANAALDRILIGAHDCYTGLAQESFTVTADFPVNGMAPGENLAPKFKARSQGVWELKLARPIKELARASLTVSIKDKQGNVSRIERTFAVGTAKLSAVNR